MRSFVNYTDVLAEIISTMKNLIKILFLALVVSSCSKNEDDTRNECTSNCTTIRGKFITADNVALPNIKVELQYRISGGELGGGLTRKIVSVRSDQNGTYHKSFYIKDNELGRHAAGYFNIIVNDSSLDPNIYIKSNTSADFSQDLGYAIFSLSRRDTIIDDTFYIPQKAFIKVNLNNFIPQQSDDYFEVQTLFPFGRKVGYNSFLDSPYSIGLSGYDNFKASGLNTTLRVFVAKGEKNVIRIIRRKNGINSFEDHAINIPPNNTIELTYN